jgi:SOS-response transcriptional repressor LexA
MKKKRNLNGTGEKVRALREKLGITQGDLARRMGYARNYISLIENGREPSKRFVRELELIEQAPFPHFDHPPIDREASFVSEPDLTNGLTTRVIPLLSWAQAGTTRAWDDLDEREGFVGFNARDPKAVAVQVRGDGMAPEFPQGTIAIVYPGCDAKSGDLVIARLKDGTVLFTRFHVDGNHYTFISLNPLYPSRTVERSKVEIVLPVGGTFRNHL